MKTIEVDERTAEVLEAQAAARGVTIGQVVADLVAFIERKFLRMQGSWPSWTANGPPSRRVSPPSRTRRSRAGLKPGERQHSSRGMSDEGAFDKHLKSELHAEGRFAGHDRRPQSLD